MSALEEKRRRDFSYRYAKADEIRARKHAVSAIDPDSDRERCRQYYARASEDLLMRRRQKYATDPEHRARILESNRRGKWRKANGAS